MQQYTGTFDAVDEVSPTINSDKFMYSLDFAGGGTVDLEADLAGDGSWEVVESYTADQAPKLWDSLPVSARLKCSTYSADVTWSITALD
jgi:hypothetical protein